MYEFRVLGPVEVVGDGGPLQLGGQKQRSLLGLLLINAGQVVSVDRLLDELWGEDPPRTASTALQNLVSHLRKLIGPELLVTRPPGYVLEIEAEQLDRARFERLLDAARQSGPEDRSRLLAEALALWRGAPYADLAFEDFAAAEVRRLAELRLEALEARIDADLERGIGVELVPELDALVSEHPLRERLRAHLMHALDAAGRRADALTLYHDGRRRLDDELGISPGPALEMAFRAILRSETGRARASAPDHHVDAIARALLGGRLVPVLGTSLDGEGAGGVGGTDVAAHLAARFGAPPEYAGDLARVAEYVALTEGVGPLYDEIHALYDRGTHAQPVHATLAGLAGTLATAHTPCGVFVTTSFGDGLEEALQTAGVPFDVVAYLALGEHRGRFLHVPPGEPARLIEAPNAYAALAPDQRTVVLKIHGGVDRLPSREWESFVVSEDDHIDYLAQADIVTVLPATLAARLRRSHFLFLGYPLRQWSLRVFLHRLFGREKLAYRSWAVGRDPDAVERGLWAQRGIETIHAGPEEYAAELAARVAVEQSIPPLRSA